MYVRMCVLTYVCMHACIFTFMNGRNFWFVTHNRLVTWKYTVRELGICWTQNLKETFVSGKYTCVHKYAQISVRVYSTLHNERLDCVECTINILVYIKVGLELKLLVWWLVLVPPKLNLSRIFLCI